MKKVIEGQPKFFDVILTELNGISSRIENHTDDLKIGLSQVTEDNNNLRDYLDTHFFKNNHQEVLTIHADKTYHQLKKSSEALISRVTEMLAEHVEQNRNLMLETLQTATTDVISQEMSLFEPVKKMWEGSFEQINKCDSISNKFMDFNSDSLNKLKIRMNDTAKKNSEVANSIKESITRFQESEDISAVTLSINETVEDIQNKHSTLRQHLDKNARFIQQSSEGFKNIDESLKRIMNFKVPTGSDESSINALIKQIDSRRVAPIASSGKTPLKPLLKSETKHRSLSRSVSPIKTIITNVPAVSPLKRKSSDSKLASSSICKKQK